ncbi:TRAP transporter small permease [Brevibacterium yomogidense]|uniref:TRAP-type C4-dicarboxylate transport system, small permease component n=1 Tax=Brevibacterium yomogidense TaxID=946573 RepID=A0A1X6XJ73_9MICO|nr:TRAP transporter small permease [Brevibacterium yomogidense]SLM99190.1 TRAP-type C4-dicarboxylate transport system, small permease component [Brevibacterium yomogidense]
MTAFMEQYRRVVDGLNLAVRWILAALMLVMTVLIGWQVIARFIVGESLTFSEEVSRFVMVWLVLLGAAYAAKNGRLMKVDIVEHMLSGKAKSTVIMVAGVLSIVFYLVLVVFGFFIVSAVSYQMTPATEVSMSIPMAALPVGGLLLIINTIHQMFGVALGVEEESEVEELVAETEAEAEIDATRLSDADDADATDSNGSQKGGDRS